MRTGAEGARGIGPARVLSRGGDGEATGKTSCKGLFRHLMLRASEQGSGGCAGGVGKTKVEGIGTAGMCSTAIGSSPKDSLDHAERKKMRKSSFNIVSVKCFSPLIYLSNSLSLYFPVALLFFFSS